MWHAAVRLVNLRLLHRERRRYVYAQQVPFWVTLFVVIWLHSAQKDAKIFRFTVPLEITKKSASNRISDTRWIHKVCPWSRYICIVSKAFPHAFTFYRQLVFVLLTFWVLSLVSDDTIVSSGWRTQYIPKKYNRDFGRGWPPKRYVCMLISSIRSQCIECLPSHLHKWFRSGQHELQMTGFREDWARL